MSEITKTEAVVLTKIDFGDSSNIVSLFTREFGKISAMVKGGKKGKEARSGIVDPPNHLQVIIYSKSSREVQLISGAEIISHYPKTKDDYEKLKYSYAVLELLKKILPEHEQNHKVFRGTVRILELIETGSEPAEVTFSRFFMFFLKESGYEIQIDKCSSCGKTTGGNSSLSYNFEIGILCDECGEGYVKSFGISAELFNYLKCLKNNLPVSNTGSGIPGISISFMEQFAKYHIPGFPGMQTLQILR